MRNDHLLTAPRWSYIVYGGGGEELYDLKKDPRQFFNLAGAPAYGGVLEDMRQMLSEKRAGVGSPN